MNIFYVKVHHNGLFESLKKEGDRSRVEGDRVIQLSCLEVF